MTNNWTLEDAEKRNAEFPDTFSIPSKDVRENLEKGSIVKLIFLPENNEEVEAERLWVEVTDKKDNVYTGRVDNDPEHIEGLKDGDIVTFEPRHVSAIWED